jgi:hypothetical protein
LSPTLATLATVTLPTTSVYLVWAKVALHVTGLTARDIGCYLTTGADGTLDGTFDSSFADISGQDSDTIPLQGELYVFQGNGTTVRLQCRTAAGNDVTAGPGLQAMAAQNVTIFP